MNDWISVEQRLPEYGQLVVVFWVDEDGEECFDFDVMDEDYEYWLHHSENYEHFCCVAKPGPESDISVAGPSEKALYTHWMILEPPR